MLKHAPIEALKGKEDIMGIAANYMFGSTFGKIVNVFIARYRKRKTISRSGKFI
jgi:APA family basic amino acid/polyamine antiporter